MGVDQELINIGLGLLLVLIPVSLFYLIIWARHQRQEIRQLHKELVILKQTVNALCSSAVGVDRRVNRLERHGRDLAERQDNIESHHQPDPPYAEAIKMVKQGADAKQLVKELGLSQGAADLILMIHGLNGEDHLLD
jgi:hypothetical protein